jgi:[CysO sulfur-carrier protein]-S-L-cysteine hydrolase
MRWDSSTSCSRRAMLKIVLPRVVIDLWRSELRKAGPREIGGVLMGEAVAQDTFRVIEASVQRDGGTATSFVRDPWHHGEAIRSFLRETGYDYTRFNYLGEWHSHPSFSTNPSLADLSAMQELLADGRIGATFACLLIVRLRFFRRLEIGAFVFTAGNGMQSAMVVRER